jgi:hypothetical protein
LVYRVGIEPTTFGLRGRISTAELPVHYCLAGYMGLNAV